MDSISCDSLILSNLSKLEPSRIIWFREVLQIIIKEERSLELY